MRVSVHRNLTWNAGRGFSILDSSMKVVDRKLHIVLTDCTFVVHPSGKKRAVETGHRNVHAFVRGELVHAGNTTTGFVLPSDVVEVSYSPFDNTGFYTVNDNVEIWGASRVWFTEGRAYVQ